MPRIMNKAEKDTRKGFGFEEAMTFKKETKGTFVYVSDDEDEPRIPTLYIRKNGAKKAPKRIVVKVQSG